MTTTPPKSTVINVSRDVISDEDGFDVSEITIVFDQDVQAWTVNVDGVDYATGIVADSGNARTIADMALDTIYNVSVKSVGSFLHILAGEEIIARVDYTELSKEGENRINIYGQNVDGVWTPYDSGQAGELPPEDVTDFYVTEITFGTYDLSWTHSISENVQDYIIYFNGFEAGVTTSNFYTIYNVRDGLIEFKVVTRSKSGLLSEGAIWSNY